ncbi:hypothetical protein [Gulosibacter sp. 10]|uniref:hypothetical protein n=1 Tax=Gulosibacter sp. 10 TaxID=1255570 RepID=UPI00111F2645|nr:hypothetical protein [Gulosibacter sp. 10]
MNRIHARRTSALLAAGALATALVGCSGGGEPVPEITGQPTAYDGVEELRDLYVAAGGECPEWEAIDPGEYDAEAGRCSDSVVISVYANPADIDEVVDRALTLATETHLLVGDNWIINTPDPHEYVDQLGGTVVTG